MLQRVVHHVVQRVDDVRVIVERVVNQDGAARLFLREHALHQVHTLLGEMHVEFEPGIGILGRLPDLVGLVGSEKIALGRKRQRQKCKKEERFHLCLPSMIPISRSSWTCWTLARSGSSVGRSPTFISS